MRLKSLQDWLVWIESCHPTEIELGLDRVAAVATALGLDFDGKCKVVTVAGTNGKGSCVASLNALLRAAGCSVGCYTSPHFLHYNERVQINGEAVDDQSLIDAFERIDQARSGIALTYFEFGTLAALDIFQRNPVDVVVLEVGLGGRLDAVNIIDADIAIVTGIAIDHQDWLGTDREQIGVEKAGIFRSGRPALCGDSLPPDSLKSVANHCGAHFYTNGEDFNLVKQPQGGWQWRGRAYNGEPLLLLIPWVNLPADSLAVAIQAVQLLNVDTIDYQCLAGLQLAGRFQSIDFEGHHLILDVAHNLAAAEFLAEKLSETTVEGRTFCLMAVMADKDAAGIVAALKACVDGWFLADLKHVPRAMPVAELAEVLHAQGLQRVSLSKNVRQALRRVLSLMGPADRLVVMGSFFTVAECMRLQQHKADRLYGEKIVNE